MGQPEVSTKSGSQDCEHKEKLAHTLEKLTAGHRHAGRRGRVELWCGVRCEEVSEGVRGCGEDV